ncbi:hypothetical protein [Bradyrhizobium sp. CER78]|uniref:hypothetical protein n=1 Tax=Bradyrhizobium sp. CER78 TaxID=3039162 RepID=UPI002448D6DA|nr:hypothetical protein [Bradyrhizobium sp. CER78]MDH2381590.1 hypothetical protein [Bradyrhizobium sp. CER78]
MLDDNDTKVLFALTVICLLVAAPLAFLSHDPPTTMQTRFMDAILVVAGGSATALFTKLKSNGRGRR